MKSERAKEIIESDMGYMTEGGWIFDVVDRVTAYQAVELAEQEAEERVYEKLTRWNDPKTHPPYGSWVLIKVFRLGGEPIFVGSIEAGNVWVTEGGLVFTDDSENDDEYVVGWREIL